MAAETSKIDFFSIETGSDMLSEWEVAAAVTMINEPNDSLMKKNLMNEVIHLLRETCKDINVDEVMSEKEVLRFLRANNWNAAKARDMVRAYANLYKEFYRFATAGIPSELDNVWNKALFTVVSKRDSHGRRVFIFKLGKWNPSDFSSQFLYTAALGLLQMISYESFTQAAGIVLIFDIEGFGFKHLKALGIDELRCLGGCLSGGFPIWFRQIHFVNNPKLFNMAYTVLKGFLGPRVKDNIVFHGTNLASLHEHVSTELLPKELGGSYVDDGQSVQTLKLKEKEVLEFMTKLREYTKIEGA